MTILLGFLTIMIALFSYGFYIHDILRGKTKPHGFTWAIWAVLSTFIFAQQITAHAGPGSWATALVAIAATIICLFSIKYGERTITTIDWLTLMAVIAVFIIWLHNFQTTIAVILASSAFLLGFIPTIRKSIKRASEETTITYALNSIKFLIALFALQSFSIETMTYPAVLFIANVCFVAFLMNRSLSSSRLKKQRRLHV